MERGPEAAVLVLVWGKPPHVLLERKSCKVVDRFSCDIAYPGGRIAPGETPVQTALREAWEEAWVKPSAVRVIGSLGVFQTISKPVIHTEAIVGVSKGPIDPRPVDPEVDAVFWADINTIGEPTEVNHPVRGSVRGVVLGKGLVLWGLSLRIAMKLKERVHELEVLDLKQLP